MSLLDEALWYATEKSWHVFPCRVIASKPFLLKNGKEKILKAKSPLTKRGLLDATLNKQQITEWWTKYPNAAIGVNCGLSNLVVVDIDTHKSPTMGFDNWMSLGVSDEGALHSQTTSGGLHIVFTGNCNSYGDENIACDLRSEGSYFIVPPSFVIVNNERKYYQKLDNWERTPVNFPMEIAEKLNLMRGVNTGTEIKRRVVTDSLDKQIETAKKALEKLPQEFCEEHHKWIKIGMALKNSLGDEGLPLWDKWSQKSEKYSKDELEYQWLKMKPNSIGLGSIVYWSKNG